MYLQNRTIEKQQRIGNFQRILATTKATLGCRSFVFSDKKTATAAGNLKKRVSNYRNRARRGGF